MTVSLTGDVTQTAIVVLQNSITTMQQTHVEESQEAAKTQDALKGEADDLRKRAIKLQTENEVLQSALNDALKVYKDLSCKVTNERDDLQLETQTLTNDVTALREKNAQFKDAVKDLEVKRSVLQESIVVISPNSLFNPLGIISRIEFNKWARRKM